MPVFFKHTSGAGLRGRDGPAGFPCGINPQLNSFLGVGEGKLLRASVGHAPGQFRHFRDEDPVFLTPVDNNFILIHEFHIATCTSKGPPHLIRIGIAVVTLQVDHIEIFTLPSAVLIGRG